jgi:uncharacterized protein YbjT (DUF2867 family)
MRILLTGASGFIGRHLVPVLTANGHTIICAARRPDPTMSSQGTEFVEADFTQDTSAARWLPKLVGVDAVINAVGIIREKGSQTFASLHVRAPCALFDACVRAGVERVINISALGADANARSRYHLSKRQADQHLAGLPLAWTIIQPSLVYGSGGTSARLFTTLASLPIIPLPAGGSQEVQPIHVDDITAGINALLTSAVTHHAIIPFVGPSPLTLREFLAELRAAMHLDRPRFVSIPLGLMRVTAQVGEITPRSLLDTETLDMLMRGNVGDPSAIRSILHREPLRPDQFIPEAEAPMTRTSAQLSWLLTLLRVSIALVWIVTGIVSFGLYPVAESYDLLARVGVPLNLAPWFLYGAASFDLLLGIATLLIRGRPALWLCQLALILFYTAVISVRIPEFWLHPYGPLLKNLPMLAVIYFLYVFEKR